MSKVFVVTEGEYSDYHIEGVFSTEEKAREYVDKRDEWKDFDDFHIEEFEMDDPGADEPFVMLTYWIDINHIEENFRDHYSHQEDLISNWFYFSLSAKHPVFQLKPEEREPVLLKIAQDRYAAYRAREAGIT